MHQRRQRTKWLTITGLREENTSRGLASQSEEFMSWFIKLRAL